MQSLRLATLALAVIAAVFVVLLDLHPVVTVALVGALAAIFVYTWSQFWGSYRKWPDYRDCAGDV